MGFCREPAGLLVNCSVSYPDSEQFINIIGFWKNSEYHTLHS